MPVPIVASTTINRQTSASTTLTFNMPGSRPDGDLFVAFGFKDDDPSWTGIPSNWKEIFQLADGTTVKLGAWWFVGNNEPASYSLTQDSEVATGIIVRVTGANLNVPIDEFGTATGSGANQSAPDINTNVGDTLVLRAIAVDRDDVTATQPVELAAGGGVGANDVGDGLSAEDGPVTPGATGTAAFTHATDGFVSATIAIAQFVAFVSDDLSDVVFPRQNSYVGPFEI